MLEAIIKERLSVIDTYEDLIKKHEKLEDEVQELYNRVVEAESDPSISDEEMDNRYQDYESAIDDSHVLEDQIELYEERIHLLNKLIINYEYAGERDF